MARSKLLTETADYDEPGSWGRASEGWPEIVGDHAADMYVFANCVADVIPYGSYVLMSEAGRYGATKSVLRVQPQYFNKLQTDFEAAGKPARAESIRRRGQAAEAPKWWIGGAT